MEKNGSIFIKLGQHLTSLNYMLPAEWCDTFIPLQDKCPVSSFESIEEMVLKDTGKSIDNLFTSFEPQPIGSAYRTHETNFTQLLKVILNHMEHRLSFTDYTGLEQKQASQLPSRL